MFGKQTKHQADLEIFTIFDTKTGAYEIPAFATNHLDMQRQMLNMFKDPNQKLNKFLVNAEDYQLFRIGSFDKRSGNIQAIQLEHICNLHDLRVLAQPSSLAEIQNVPKNETVGMHLT